MEYELGGVGETGPRIVDETGTIVVGGSEVDGTRTRLLDADGEPVLVMEDPGVLDRNRCEIRTVDGRVLGTVEGRPQAATWRSALLGPDGDRIGTIRSTTGRLRTLLFNATLGLFGSLRLEVVRGGRRLAAIEVGRWQLPRRITIEPEAGEGEELIRAYCLGFHVASRYATDGSTPGAT